MGQFVKTVRLRLGMTQEEFAQRIGTTGRTISKWETAKAVPQKSNVKAIASFLHHRHRALSVIFPAPIAARYRKLCRISNYTFGNQVSRGKFPRVCTKYCGPKHNIACGDCGSLAQQYDHRDYFFPLEAEPVCQSCNVRRGLAINTFVNHWEFWSKYRW